MKYGKYVLLVLLASLVETSGSIGGTSTLYVDKGNPNCLDTGPGSATQPFCTIGAAAAIATAGQTVVVSPGTYSEGVSPKNSGTSTAPIVFMAAAGAPVTVTGQSHGFSFTNKSWITVQGFNVTATTSDGVLVTTSSNITLESNHVSNCGHPVSGQTARGIKLNGVTSSLVSNNVIDHNTDYGIFVTGGSTGLTIVGNAISYNARGFQVAAAGIRIGSTGTNSGNTIQGNVCHNNEDSGIELTTASNNNLIVDNVTYLNGSHGIDVEKSTGVTILSNSVYKNVTEGINVEGSSTGATLANNISVDNGTNSPQTKGDIRVDLPSTTGATLDYDIAFLHSGTTLIVWGSTPYSSIAAFRAATGQESNGIQADPLWEAPDNGDLRLLEGSPAIDSANSGVNGETTVDADGNPRVDDPATPNTGTGPRAYDDRGAYEFQPGRPTPTPAPTSPPSPTPTHAPTATPTPVLPTPTPPPTAPPGSTPTPSPIPTATRTPSANLVGNPGFETGTQGWNTGGSCSTAITLNQFSGGHSGSFSAQLANTGTTACTCTLNDSPNWVAKTSAGTYVGSLWVRADVAGATLRLRFREYNGGTLVGTQTTTATLGTTWQLVSVSYVPVAPGSSTLDFNAYVSSAASGTCFYADDAGITVN